MLKAIAAVFGEYTVTPKDKRKRIGNETILSHDYYVRAIFELNEDDFNEISNSFKQTYTNMEEIQVGLEKEVSNFIQNHFKNVNKKITIGDNSSPFKTYFTINKSHLKKFDNLIFENDNVSIGTPQNTNNISTAIFNCITSYWEDFVSNCYYWSFNESFLLPSKVSITSFQSNPEICEPLKNVFVLCNRSDISKQFKNAIEEDGDYENLLEQVSQEVTSVFREIWGDFKNTEIELRPNGEEISIKIKEKVKYNFEDRSDGFKKFISILLMISTRVRKNSIDDLDIVLFDEPDQSLYPTSARFLRDELLKLSDKTKIIYSTHSQFMIDSECVDRHIVVEKKEDITTLNKYNAISPFSDDELLRRAIGTSVFECLKEHNIIFEGWLDKQLFEFYLKSNPTKSKKFENVGRVFLSGISSVETLVQILILANKNFVIVADSDQTSNNKRADFNESFNEYSDKWIGYSDVLSSIETMEDFLKPNYIELKLKNKQDDYKFKTTISAIKNIDNVIKEKIEKQTFKKELIVDLKKQDLIADYSKLVDHIILKIGEK